MFNLRHWGKNAERCVNKDIIDYSKQKSGRHVILIKMQKHLYNNLTAKAFFNLMLIEMQKYTNMFKRNKIIIHCCKKNKKSQINLPKLHKNTNDSCCSSKTK